MQNCWIITSYLRHRMRHLSAALWFRPQVPRGVADSGADEAAWQQRRQQQIKLYAQRMAMNVPLSLVITGLLQVPPHPRI